MGFPHEAEDTTLYSCLKLLEYFNNFGEQITIYTDRIQVVSMLKNHFNRKYLSNHSKPSEINEIIHKKSIELVWVSRNKNKAHKLIARSQKETLSNSSC